MNVRRPHLPLLHPQHVPGVVHHPRPSCRTQPALCRARLPGPQDSVEFMRDEWYTYKKPGWLAAGLAKQKVALDVVAHGFDLMLLDSDLVFFRDPMDVMRTIWQADFATLSDCVAFNYTAEQFPEIPWGYHMGILWVR